MNKNSYYGDWTIDSAGLPCFDLMLEENQAPEAPFRHLIGTGRLSALADRWGNVNLFTTEGGFAWLNSPFSAFARSSLYMMVETDDGELHSLIYSELQKKGAIRVGLGYVEYSGELQCAGAHLRVVQQVFAPPNRGSAIFSYFVLTNLSSAPAKIRLEIRSDVTLTRPETPARRPTDNRRATELRPGHAGFPNADPHLGGIFLAADAAWEGSAHRASLRLRRSVRIEPGERYVAGCATGYGLTVPAVFPKLADSQLRWRAKMQPFAVEAPELWMQQECLWNAGQLLSFASYDSSVGEYYIALGGYGWECFSVREVSETSMVLAACDWELAASSLRFVAKTQLASGDVPKVHTMRQDRSSTEFDSDNELWFLLGCCESVRVTGNRAFFDEICSFWDGGEATMWEHLKRAFFWVRDRIGRGAHGLILIREGDWNDYLSLMGTEGRGESVMNSGIACRALDGLGLYARERGEASFAHEVEEYTKELRRAVGALFDREWFPRGFTDEGKPVGSFHEDRLFINAQSWPVLGKCGTPEQRRKALLSAVEKCHTDIGLMLMSRPFSSPSPDDISWCAIPAGEGENAGIWPQTIYWMVWALAEEGLLEEALAEWKCGTLRNHAWHFPEVPFGIFNGSDCFSSKWAGKKEGWTQVQLINRAQFVPMNPMIAWQRFAMEKINQAMQKNGAAHSPSPAKTTTAYAKA